MGLPSNGTIVQTSHGKGPIDGLGAVLKIIAFIQVLTRKAIINNAEDFHHVVSN